MNKVLSHKPKLKRGLFYRAGLLMIFILGLSSIFSPIRVLPFFNQLWALCYVLWLVFSVLDKPNYFLIPSKFRFLFYFYFFYTITIAYLAGNGVIGNKYFELSQLPLFYLAFEKNKLQGRNSDNLLLLKWISPFILYTSIITLSAYRVNPEVSRTLKVNHGLALEYARIGVGGYEFIYFLVLLIPILLFIFYRDNFNIKKVNKIFGLLVIFILSINVVLSNYATALFLLFIGFIVMFFFNKIKYSRILFYLLLVMVSYFLFDFLIITIFDFLLDNLDKTTRNFSRVFEARDYIITGESGKSISARNYTFVKSIDMFFDHPIFGIVVDPISTNSNGKITGFGQHSQTLDTFALYGVVIGVLQLWLYSYPIYSRFTEIRGSVNNLSLSILIIFLILTTINIATPSIGFAVFFIFPTVYEKYLVTKANSGTNKKRVKKTIYV